MKNIVVFGANGQTGKLVVDLALKRQYNVTAIVRNPENFEAKHSCLTVIKGDVLKFESFRGILVGQDAVISCIGSGSTKPTNIYSEGIKNVLVAMKEAGVKRFICISAAGLDVNPLNGWFIRLLTKHVLQRILNKPYNDLRLMEREVKLSCLDYTILRPPRLLNTPPRNVYRAKINENLENTGTLSRGDLAHYIIAHLEDPANFKATVHLSY